jgi:hypothetical protein
MSQTPAASADQIIDAAAAMAPGTKKGVEQRKQRRLPYDALVAVLLTKPGGGREAPAVLRAHDLSAGGLSVTGSKALESGAVGVLQLVRSDGQFAMVGVEVRHCRYLGQMEHRTGLKFVPMPDGFTREEFLDENGRLMLLDPLLRTNVGT